VASSGDSNKAVLYAVAGIFLGGIGFVIIYFDMAKDKIGGNFDELGTLAKGYEQKERDKQTPQGWHMPEGDIPHDPPIKKQP
jgi:hypothetical protein